jgi:hypothetical protein
VAKKKREAEGFVEDARKGMGGIECDRGKERVDLLVEKFSGEVAIFLAEFLPRQEGDAGAFELRNEVIIPAGVLLFDELVEMVAKTIEMLILGEASLIEGLGEALVFFELLKDAGYADFYEFVEVAGGDGEEFDALEQRVRRVVGFFEDAAIELQPALVAIDEATTGDGLRRRL